MRIQVYILGAIVNIIAEIAAAVTGFGAGRFPPFWQYCLLGLTVIATGLLVRQRAPKLLRLYAMVEGSIVFLLSSSPILVICYAAQTFGFPLRDDVYRAADLALGFDGAAIITWVGGHPLLCRGMKFLYDLFFPAMFAAIAAGAYYGSALEVAERTAISITLAFLVSAGLSSVLPAYGYGASLTPDLIEAVATGATPVAQLDALRDGSMRILDLGEVGGIITFPSMHWALAIILLRTTFPVRWLFIAAVPVSLGFMGTALVQGAHYLADVFAGGLVGLLSVWVADRVLRIPALDAVEERVSIVLSGMVLAGARPHRSSP